MSKHHLPPDYAARIKVLRERLNLSQSELAKHLDTTLSTVSKWEAGQSKPAALVWKLIRRLEESGPMALGPLTPTMVAEPRPHYGAPDPAEHEMDFRADPEVVRAVAEAERLTYGHLASPSFATEIFDEAHKLSADRLPDFSIRNFIRRTKEEMVYYDGEPIYPMRISDTLSYDLTQGDISEQKLYDETTKYINNYYNRARILNRSAARLAMTVFQRRLASSTAALLRSLERRIEKLSALIEAIRSGKLTTEQLEAHQRRLADAPDVLATKTSDEEDSEDGSEENERSDEHAMGVVAGRSIAELEVERTQVEGLLDLARKVYDKADESKFTKLLEVLQDNTYRNEKMLIFTEHRDTLDFLVRRLSGLGYTDQVAQIHGGMDFNERQDQVEFFRKTAGKGRATYMVCTDAVP